MKKIKNILILVFIASMVSSVHAREGREVVIEDDISQHSLPLQSHFVTPKREIKFSIGAYPLFANEWDYHYYMSDYSSFSKENYDRLLMFSDSYISASFSLGYSYEIYRWFSLGATLSYVKESERSYSRIDNSVIDRYSNHNLAIVPMAKFTYLNRPMVRLYSQVGVGIRVQIESSNRYFEREPVRLSGSITYFGISVGKRIFGSMEFASGAQGSLILGGGYRF